jgi:gliding motility-associated lipoprotein GldD
MGKKQRIALILIALAVLTSLTYIFAIRRPAPTPRPRAYFRIDLPKKEYFPFMAECPVNFEAPMYSKIENKAPDPRETGCWFNVMVPRLKATLYCAYIPVHNDLDQLVQRAYDYTIMHDVKATAIRRTDVEIDSTHVYGIIYDLEGDAASQLQFFVTDSTKHFLRGVLYFRDRPNADSLAPVLSFMREDVIHMIETLRWRD